MPIRVASYNIRKSVGRDYRRDPMRVLGILDRIRADVVAIQEADKRFGSRDTSIPRDMLEDHSDFQLVELSARPNGIGWHGNAVLLRHDIELLDQSTLDLPGLEPRGAVATAEMRALDQPLCFSHPILRPYFFARFRPPPPCGPAIRCNPCTLRKLFYFFPHRPFSKSPGAVELTIL